MNEQVDNAEYEYLWKLLANPADPNHSYIFNLQSLVTDFPQSGALRALLMPNGDKRHLKHAAAYFNPGVLHKLATAPDSLPLVTAGQIVYSDEPPPVPADIYFNIRGAEPFVPPVTEPGSTCFPVIDDGALKEAPLDHYTGMQTPYHSFAEQEAVADKPVDLETAHHTEVQSTEPVANAYPEEILAYTDAEHETYSYPTGENAVDHADDVLTRSETAPFATEPAPAEKEDSLAAPVAEEENMLAQEYAAYLTESNAQPTELVSSYDERYFHQAIDDEVYEEIVSIEDIGLEQLAILNKSAKQEGTEPVTSTKAEENYFVFEPEIAKSSNVGVDSFHPAITAEGKPAWQQIANDQARSNVSRYNDEKMPYTFMWWLDKTRKEHAEVYQPYVNNSVATIASPKKKEVFDELQQQYYQNIVSTSSINELDQIPPKTTANPSPKKGAQIIERFIQEEPQIKHPSGIKLDNENKAKRSSEDKEELVTETLARIYTEQMLYHKAILTYKKLMLKFPEKSLYFAGQIEQLESKIN